LPTLDTNSVLVIKTAIFAKSIYLNRKTNLINK